MSGYIDVDLSQIDKAVKRATRAGLDLRPVWRELRQPLRKTQGDHIKQQQSADGGKFAPLARSTVERRLRQGGRRRNFTKKGRVKKGAQRRIGKVLSLKLTSRARMKAKKASLSITARGKLAHLHQGGGKAGRGRRSIIPARPFMYVDDALARQAWKRVSEYIAKAFEK